MNIVIVGAGSVGQHISSMFSEQQHNVILIDKNSSRLEQAAWHMDVATRQGSGTDLRLLESLLETSPDFFIALTNDDEANLVSCSIAKNLGYPQTIARVRDKSYLNRKMLDFGRIFNVDYFIGPELLAAQEIYKYLINPSSLAMESFAHGAVQLRTIVIPTDWSYGHKTIAQLQLPSGLLVALIYRQESNGNHTLIFPHGNDHILPGDHVSIIGEVDSINSCYDFFGIDARKIKSVVIVGGSLTGLNLAQILSQQQIDVRIIEKSKDKCEKLAERLPLCTVINHDGTDIDFLKSEKIQYADALIACTKYDEINFLVALLAKKLGCHEIILHLSNASYNPLGEQIGISLSVSPRILAGNKILSMVHSGKISSIISLYDGEAEVMEVNVSTSAKVAGVPLSELGGLLPKDFLIATIQNRGRVYIANGGRIISPGDTVVVVGNPKHLSQMEKIF